MNYHNISHDDQNNGDGLRVVLWLSGCHHFCKNCQNQQTWRPDSGIEFDSKAREELFEQLSKDYISGITLSGGDPLAEENVKEVWNLVRFIKCKFPKKTIWIYTGYTWDQIMYPAITDAFDPNRNKIIQLRKDITTQCNVLIDGKYIDELRDTTLKWRGSSNQRIIDVQSTLLNNKIVLWCD